jgi:hypothetical protein
MMIARLPFIFAIFLMAPQAFANDISGFWKHPEAPAWIEISLDAGKGTVIRNDKFPERVGREILKDLKADDSVPNVWQGQVYAERMGEYKDAEISLPEPDRMEFKVKGGFVSRTIEWVRVEEIPPVQAE